VVCKKPEGQHCVLFISEAEAVYQAAPIFAGLWNTQVHVTCSNLKGVVSSKINFFLSQPKIFSFVQVN
jgi:hypothetical protein